MLLTLAVLIALLIFAVAAAVYSVLRDRDRHAVLGRAGGHGRDELIALKPIDNGVRERVARWIARHTPYTQRDRDRDVDQLVHAGYDSAAAPAVYTALRVMLALVAPLLALALVPRNDEVRFLVAFALAVMVGLFLPPAFVARQARLRQERLRRALPDSLDLLVVCVEAGVSLDAAILRVAREMAMLHPELASELMLVSRRVNAGIPRNRALRGLWVRTGVEELRGLAANMIQSEKWGTSIATVLRVYAESSRKKRKQLAEKKAATAPLKMLFPMAVFIFPSIFIVLLGPAIIKIAAMLGQMAR